MKTFDELRQVLSLQKQSLCENYQITEIGIFGSYARGEQTELSDVGFDFAQPAKAIAGKSHLFSNKVFPERSRREHFLYVTRKEAKRSHKSIYGLYVYS